jgi:hypothetical protein
MGMVKWYLKRVSSLIQIINDHGIKNKYDLIKKTHYMLKCSNQNFLDEGIIVTLRNWLLKG